MASCRLDEAPGERALLIRKGIASGNKRYFLPRNVRMLNGGFGRPARSPTKVDKLGGPRSPIGEENSTSLGMASSEVGTWPRFPPWAWFW